MGVAVTKDLLRKIPPSKGDVQIVDAQCSVLGRITPEAFILNRVGHARDALPTLLDASVTSMGTQERVVPASSRSRRRPTSSLGGAALCGDMAADHLDILLDELLRVRTRFPYLGNVEYDSMEGVGMLFGDLLIMDKRIDARAGQVIMGVVNQQPLVKDLAFEGISPVLRSVNRKYPERFVMKAD
ncbi:S24 family peptidase [Pseudomonas sp. W5-01]|uniref:S24 family peptidase n=1 Tax=Pseudomonas sp. W5-01 TaxID=3097454 RepID=UPI00397AC369